MPIITVSSNNRVWYLIGAIFFVLVGVAVAIAGFAKVGVLWGVTGIAITVVATVLLVDAIINMTS
jgi:NAD/NADP transhydrogenase beta subunit